MAHMRKNRRSGTSVRRSAIEKDRCWAFVKNETHHKMIRGAKVA
jgi:hypothetical protein